MVKIFEAPDIRAPRIENLSRMGTVGKLLLVSFLQNTFDLKDVP